MVNAEKGHIITQVPQKTHFWGSYTSGIISSNVGKRRDEPTGPREIASLGHTRAQVPHPIHLVLSKISSKLSVRNCTLTCSTSLLIDLEIFGNEIFYTSFYFY